MGKIIGFLRDETGLELSEYAVAAALVTIPVTVAFTDLGSKVNAALDSLTNKIKNN